MKPYKDATMIPIDSKSKKPSKKEAYARIKMLQEAGILTTAQIEGLLLYFVPTIPKKAKTAMEWLAKAVAISDVRNYLNYIWVGDDGVGYGSDGHAAHRAKLEGYAEGFYCPKTLMPVTGVKDKYPDMNRIFYDKEAHYTVDYSELSSNILDRRHAMLVCTYNDSHINKAMLDTAMNGHDSSITMYAIPTKANNILHSWRGVSQFGDFIVMGITED